MACSRLRILDAAPSLDALPPLLAPNLIPTPASNVLRDIAARAPVDAAAQRFIKTPGPVERAQRLARIIEA